MKNMYLVVPDGWYTYMTMRICLSIEKRSAALPFDLILQCSAGNCRVE